jgi:glycosyltransferase involved in cell wall biosynthesis
VGSAILKADPLEPSVSIIIPTLQEEKLIGRTLGQFSPDLRKRYNLEVVVSDGGSKDGTLDIARGSADRLLFAQEGLKQNISKGRNIGARNSRGEILIFINADTIIENIEQFLDVMIETIRRPDVMGATCSVGVYREEERLSDKLFHGFYNWYFGLLNRLGMGMGRGECHVIRRRTFLDVGGYNEQMAAGEDYELFLRLRRMGKISFLKGLRVNESPRRYRKYGYVHISLLWFLNAVFVFVFGRSLHKEWKPIR